MAIINYTDQIKYTGKGYLDAKMMPVNTYDDLKKIQMSQRFEGLTVVVLNNGNPQDYWLIGGISNSCWQPKTATSFEDLRIVLEDGFLKLTNAGVQLGDAVDFNEFFPSQPGTGSGDDLFIESVDYTTKDAAGKTGVFMCFTYSDGTKKYLDMSQFLSATYKAGSGIVIDGDVISLDEAVVGRITALEETIETVNTVLDTKADASALEEVVQSVADEATARKAADITMSGRIETISGALDTKADTSALEEVAQSVADEKAAREAADADMLDRVNELSAEDATLLTKVEEVAQSVADEKAAREEALAEVSTRIEEVAQSVSDAGSAVETKVEEVAQSVADEKAAREAADAAQQAVIDELSAKVTEVEDKVTAVISDVESNTEGIANNKTELETLKERVNALSSAAEGSTPDGRTIGITEDEQKALYVKILDKEGNALQVETNDKGESGLYVNVPVSEELVGAVEEATQAIAETKAEVEANTVAIAETKAEVEANTTAIAENAAKLETNTQAIAEQSVAIQGVIGEIDDVKANVEANAQALAENADEIANVKAGVEANTTTIAENAAAVQTNATAIQNVQEALKSYLVKNVDANDKVLNVADGILSSQIGLVYEGGWIKLTGKDGLAIEGAGFDASEFVKDGMLQNVELKPNAEGEQCIVFTWKDNEIAPVELKVSEFAKIYKAGTALNIAEDGQTINVKVAENDNFLTVNANNELIVDDVTTDKTMIKENITIEGGPLATDAVKAAFPNGVITTDMDIQSVLKALLCVEIYPTPVANTPSYSVSIVAPSITAVDVVNGALVEVGQVISFNEVSAKAVTITKTEPKVSGFEHGYSETIDGDVNSASSVSGAWSIEQKTNNVYELSAAKTNFEGTVPTTQQAVDAVDCTLAACELVAVFGDNTYSVTEDAPKHIGSHNGVDSYYVISNLGGRVDDKKSVSIEAESDVEKDPVNKTATFTVTGVYPVYTNGVTASTIDATGAAMSDLAEPVADYGTKLPLMKASTSFAVSFAHQDLEPYTLCLPGTWVIKTAKAIDPLTKTYASDCKANFKEVGTVTKQVQGKDVTYKVYAYGESAGPNRVKFTVG